MSQQVVAGSKSVSRPAQGGFTLLEMLVVIAILVMLSALLLPAFAVAKQKAQGIVCIGNLRQIQAAMLLYGVDHEDYVVWNADYVRGSWVFSGEYERAPVLSAGCTNLAWLVQPHYAAHADYIHCPAVYHCPGDKTTVQVSGRLQPWVRSYGASFYQRKMSDFDTLSQLGTEVSPALHRTFEEVHPGYLICLGGVFATPDAFVTFPSDRHNGAGCFAFADGHVELHRWADSRSRRPNAESLSFDKDGASSAVLSCGNLDLEWLCRHSDSGLGYNRQDDDIMRAVKADPSLWQMLSSP